MNKLTLAKIGMDQGTLQVSDFWTWRANIPVQPPRNSAERYRPHRTWRRTTLRISRKSFGKQTYDIFPEDIPATNFTSATIADSFDFSTRIIMGILTFLIWWSHGQFNYRQQIYEHRACNKVDRFVSYVRDQGLNRSWYHCNELLSTA